MHLGQFIKQLRLQKGISQSEASLNAVTQSNYSKFELGKVEISATAFFKIIHNLDISLEEFVMLYENVYSTKMNEVVNSFLKMRSNKTKELITIRENAKEYLSNTNTENQTLQHIIELTYALEAISERQDYEEAKIYANPIWEKLQKRDCWYLREITLLNTILYIFPFETAEEITKRSLKFLKSYPKNNSIIILQFNLIINISLLCIKNSKIEKSLTYLHHSLTLLNNQIPLEFHKKLVQIRIAYCNAILNKDFSQNLMSTIMYFYSTDNLEMLNHLKKEAGQYCTNPLFFKTVKEYEDKINMII